MVFESACLEVASSHNDISGLLPQETESLKGTCLSLLSVSAFRSGLPGNQQAFRWTQRGARINITSKFSLEVMSQCHQQYPPKWFSCLQPNGFFFFFAFAFFSKAWGGGNPSSPVRAWECYFRSSYWRNVLSKMVSRRSTVCLEGWVGCREDMIAQTKKTCSRGIKPLFWAVFWILISFLMLAVLLPKSCLLWNFCLFCLIHL